MTDDLLEEGGEDPKKKRPVAAPPGDDYDAILNGKEPAAAMPAPSDDYDTILAGGTPATPVSASESVMELGPPPSAAEQAAQRHEKKFGRAPAEAITETDQTGKQSVVTIGRPLHGVQRIARSLAEGGDVEHLEQLTRDPNLKTQIDTRLGMMKAREGGVELAPKPLSFGSLGLHLAQNGFASMLGLSRATEPDDQRKLEEWAHNGGDLGEELVPASERTFDPGQQRYVPGHPALTRADVLAALGTGGAIGGFYAGGEALKGAPLGKGLVGAVGGETSAAGQIGTQLYRRGAARSAQAIAEASGMEVPALRSAMARVPSRITATAASRAGAMAALEDVARENAVEPSMVHKLFRDAMTAGARRAPQLKEAAQQAAVEGATGATVIGAGDVASGETDPKVILADMAKAGAQWGLFSLGVGALSAEAQYQAAYHSIYDALAENPGVKSDLAAEQLRRAQSGELAPNALVRQDGAREGALETSAPIEPAPSTIRPGAAPASAAVGDVAAPAQPGPEGANAETAVLQAAAQLAAEKGGGRASPELFQQEWGMSPEASAALAARVNSDFTPNQTSNLTPNETLAPSATSTDLGEYGSILDGLEPSATAATFDKSATSALTPEKPNGTEAEGTPSVTGDKGGDTDPWTAPRTKPYMQHRERLEEAFDGDADAETRKQLRDESRKLLETLSPEERRSVTRWWYEQGGGDVADASPFRGRRGEPDTAELHQNWQRAKTRRNRARTEQLHAAKLNNENLVDVATGRTPPNDEPAPAKPDPIDERLAALKQRVESGERVEPTTHDLVKIEGADDVEGKVEPLHQLLTAAKKAGKVRVESVPKRESLGAWLSARPADIALHYLEVAGKDREKALALLETDADVIARVGFYGQNRTGLATDRAGFKRLAGEAIGRMRHLLGHELETDREFPPGVREGYDAADDEFNGQRAAAPERASIKDAQTGEPLRVKLLRGEGATESPYNPLGAQVPILGRGRYGTPNRAYAAHFGPKITEHEASLRNPLVIDSDRQWADLTHAAGWKYANPSTADAEQTKADIQRLRRHIEDLGHDGVVVRIPMFGKNQVDERTGKTLDRVFGADQVIEFAPSGRTAPEPKQLEKPAPTAKSFYNPEGRRAIITKSAQVPGQFQLSYFHDPEGTRPFAHETGQSVEDLQRSAAKEGYDIPERPNSPADEEAFEALRERLSILTDIRKQGDEWTSKDQAAWEKVHVEMKELLAAPAPKQLEKPAPKTAPAPSATKLKQGESRLPVPSTIPDLDTASETQLRQHLDDIATKRGELEREAAGTKSMRRVQFRLEGELSTLAHREHLTRERLAKKESASKKLTSVADAKRERKEKMVGDLRTQLAEIDADPVTLHSGGADGERKRKRRTAIVNQIAQHGETAPDAPAAPSGTKTIKNPKYKGVPRGELFEELTQLQADIDAMEAQATEAFATMNESQGTPVSGSTLRAGMARQNIKAWRDRAEEIEQRLRGHGYDEDDILAARFDKEHAAELAAAARTQEGTTEEGVESDATDFDPSSFGDADFDFSTSSPQTPDTDVDRTDAESSDRTERDGGLAEGDGSQLPAEPAAAPGERRGAGSIDTQEQPRDAAGDSGARPEVTRGDVTDGDAAAPTADGERGGDGAALRSPPSGRAPQVQPVALPDVGGDGQASLALQLGGEGSRPDVRRPDGTGDARSGRTPAVRGETVDSGLGANPGGQPRDAGSGAGRPRRVAPPVTPGTAVAPRTATPENGTPLENFRITDDTLLAVGGPKQRIQQNLAAIVLARQLAAEGRAATREEQLVLARYVGWGDSALAKVFDELSDTADKWEAERQQLKTILTPEEYAAARASTTNAHYTSPDVIRAIYGVLKDRLHVGGVVNMLEPAAGVGHFLGLAPVDDWDVRPTMVELDPTTASIAKALYPLADIRAQGFQHAKLPTNYYDLVVGNPPFGDVSVADPAYDKHKLLIHDYFFVKALDHLRPGGILAFVTSNGTMDKKDSSARGLMAERAEFLGGVRLPNTAFQENAGTSVVTDVLFFQKRYPVDPDVYRRERAWRVSKGIALRDAKGRSVFDLFVNEYFLNVAGGLHNVLGEHSAAGSMYRGSSYTVLPTPGRGSGAPLTQDMVERLDITLNGAYLPPNKVPRADALKDWPHLQAPANLREGWLTTVKNERGVTSTARVENGLLQPFPMNGTNTEKAKQLIALRDAVVRLRAVQSSPYMKGEDFDTALVEANQLYDRFVAKHGPINLERSSEGVFKTGPRAGQEYRMVRRPNLDFFKVDPSYPHLQALEVFDSATNTATKTDLLKRRLLTAPSPITHADSPREAVAPTLNARGYLDVGYMAQLTGQELHDVEDAIRGSIAFENPLTGKWEIAAEYLSGNVKAKLAVARQAAKTHPERYGVNVSALEPVIPEDLKPSQIYVRLGGPWIPVSDYEAFARSVFGNGKITITYVPHDAGAYKVDADSTMRESSGATITYGTATREGNGIRVFTDALNQRAVQITETDHDGKTVQMVDESINAQRQQEALRARFAEWVWEDPARATRLARLYNDLFNTSIIPTYDGSFLEVPSTAKYVRGVEFHWSPWQKDAIWRIITAGNTLLAHVVGAGKTFTMIAAGMEMKRLGMVRKPMYTVPNHMLEQFSREFLQLYPNANVLIATKKDFEKKKRREFTAKIASQDWDAIIMTHRSFEAIGVSVERQIEHIKAELLELRAEIEATRKERAPRSVVKQIEKAASRLATKLERLMAGKKKDDLLSFEELGVDHLFVDEAHMFKNLEVRSKMVGVGKEGSERAYDLLLKTQVIDERSPGRGMTFATGTPVSNSMAEVYTMQRYLQPAAMRAAAINRFDEWAATFGESVVGAELAPDGSGYRMKERFARFQNLPELMQLFRQIADVRLAADIFPPDKPGERGRRPQLLPPGAPIVATKKKNALALVSGEGKANVVLSKPTLVLKGLVRWLIRRAEAVKAGDVDPSEDNFLKITTEGRFGAMDTRLVSPFGFGTEGSKVEMASINIARVWRETGELRGTQLVFSDIGTPKGKPKQVTTVVDEEGNELIAEVEEPGEGATADDAARTMMGVPGYNVYDELRDRLVKLGVPLRDIKFIHEAKNDQQKQQIIDDVKAGKIRVLIGSTEKMGAGMNAQDRAVAIHHLDAPWRPSDLEQRNGRVIRQGNVLWEQGLINGVAEYRYGMEESFDAYMWQTLERKAGFIGPIMKGDMKLRSVEDLDSTAMDLAEMKAATSGNPLVKEKNEVDVAVMKLEIAARAHRDAMILAQGEVAHYASVLERTRQYLAGVEKDAVRVAGHDLSGDKFVVTLGGQEVTDRGRASERLHNLAHKAIVAGLGSAKQAVLGQLGSFRILVVEGHTRRRKDGLIAPEYTIALDGTSQYYQGDPFFVDDVPTHGISSLEYHYKAIPKLPEEYRAEIANAESRIAEFKAQRGKSFPDQERLEQLIVRQRQLAIELRAHDLENAEEPIAEEGSAHWWSLLRHGIWPYRKLKAPEDFAALPGGDTDTSDLSDGSAAGDELARKIQEAIANRDEADRHKAKDIALSWRRTLLDLRRQLSRLKAGVQKQLGAGAEPEDEPGRWEDDGGLAIREPVVYNLFGEPEDDGQQDSLFGGTAGTEASRPLAGAEAAARSELDRLQAEENLAKGKLLSENAAKAQRVRRTRMAELSKLVNRDRKIGSDELGLSLEETAIPFQQEEAEARRAFGTAKLAGQAATQLVEHAPLVAKVIEKGLPTSLTRQAHIAIADRRAMVSLVGQRIKDSAHAAQLLWALRSPSMERMHTLYHDEAGNILGHSIHTSGSLSYVMMGAGFRGQIVAEAMRLGATHVTVAHNHPSGDPTPSDADKVFTKDLELYLQAKDLVLARHVVTDHDTATAIEIGAFGMHRIKQFDVEPPAGALDWTAPDPRQLTLERTAELVRDATPEKGILVLYLDTGARVVAAEPFSGVDVHALLSMLPERIKTHRAHAVVLGTDRDRAGTLAFFTIRRQMAYEEGVDRVIDVIGIDPGEPINGATLRHVSWRKMGQIRPFLSVASRTQDVSARVMERGAEEMEREAKESGDIIPLPRPTGLGREQSPIRVGDAKQELQRLFNPESLDEKSRGTAGTIRHENALSFRQLVIAREALKALSRQLDGLSRSEQVRVWDAAEKGHPTGDEQLDQGVELLHRITANYTAQLVASGHLNAEAAIENYIGRFWSVDQNPRANAFMATIRSRRPLEGPKSFLKHRSLEHFVDGLKAGLTPATYNFVDAQLSKIAEMQRLIAADRMLLQELAHGRAARVMDSSMGKKPPVDEDGAPWVKIDPTEQDPAFIIFGPKRGAVKVPEGSQLHGDSLEGATRLKPNDVEVYGKRIMGHWYAPRSSAALWAAHLSKGFRGRSALYDAVASVGQAAAQLILGISGFHATVIATEGTISDVALAIDSLVNTGGKAKNAPKQLLHAVHSAVSTARLGGKIMREYRAPGSAPEYAAVLQRMLAGGYRGTAASEIWSDGERWKKLRKRWATIFDEEAGKSERAKDFAKIPHSALFAVLEAVSAPLMGKYVPAMKTGAAYLAMAQAMAKMEPERVTLESVRQVASDVMHEMDYRFGQVVYDNHFMDRRIKDIAQLMFLAPGWTFGTLALMERGVEDVVDVPRRFVERRLRDRRGGGGGGGGGDGTGNGTGDQGERRRRSDRRSPVPPELVGKSAAYWIGAVLVTMLLNGIITWALTGEEPEGMDYFAFRDGTFDRSGNPNRHTIPGYLMHDVYGWTHHAFKTFLNKLSPALAFFARWQMNRTYFGDQIYDPDASTLTQVKQTVAEAGRNLGPLSIRNYLESRQRGEGGAAEIVRNAFGINPAKRELQRTTAQNKMAEYLSLRGHTARTPDQVKAGRSSKDIRADIRAGEISKDSAKKLVKHGVITSRQKSLAFHDAKVSPLVADFRRLSAEQAERVYALATPAEKQLWRRDMDKKRKQLKKQEQ